MNLTAMIVASDPFCDEGGNGYGHIPAEDRHGDELRLEYPLDSPEFRQWVKKQLHELTGKLATDKMTDQAIDVFKGHALERPRRMPANPPPSGVIKLSPLGQVIKDLAEAGGFEGTPTEFWGKASRRATKLQLGDHPDWPTSVDSFGKQVAALIPVLKAIHIHLDRDPTDRPRRYTLHPKGYRPAESEERLVHEGDLLKTIDTSPDASVGDVSAGSVVEDEAYDGADTSAVPTHADAE